jgi:hypothetical protein
MAAAGMASAALAAPGDPMVTLIATRPIPEPALIVELRDADGVPVWPVPGEILFASGKPKAVTLREGGLHYAFGATRPVALRLDMTRFGAGRLSYPIPSGSGARITLRYVAGE